MTRISSRSIIYYKRIFPALWFGFLAAFVATAVIAGKGNEDPMVFVVPIVMAIERPRLCLRLVAGKEAMVATRAGPLRLGIVGRPSRAKGMGRNCGDHHALRHGLAGSAPFLVNRVRPRLPQRSPSAHPTFAATRV